MGRIREGLMSEHRVSKIRLVPAEVAVGGERNNVRDAGCSMTGMADDTDLVRRHPSLQGLRPGVTVGNTGGGKCEQR